MEFKDLIKNRRLGLGLTLDEVGKSVGVAKATVQRWESGNIKNIRRDKIYALSKALHTTPAYLMGWEEKEPVKEDDELFQENIKLFSQLNEDHQKQVLKFLRFLTQTEEDD